MKLRPHEASFLLAVARLLVGKYGYTMTFERAGDWFTIESGPPYGFVVEYVLTIESARVCTNATGTVLCSSDVADRIRQLQRALIA